MNASSDKVDCEGTLSANLCLQYHRLGSKFSGGCSIVCLGANDIKAAFFVMSPGHSGSWANAHQSPLGFPQPNEQHQRWQQRSRARASRCHTVPVSGPPESRLRSTARACDPRPLRQSSTFVLCSPVHWDRVEAGARRGKVRDLGARRQDVF